MAFASIKLFLTLVVYAVTCSSARGQALEESADFLTACRQARTTGKTVYVLFTNPRTCVPCRWYEEVVLADSAVQKTLQKEFEFLRLRTTDPSYDSLKTAWKLTSLPTHMFVDTNGSLLHSFMGGATRNCGDSTIRSFLRIFDDARSPQMNLRYLLERFETGQATESELRNLARRLKPLNPTYPEELVPTAFSKTMPVVSQLFDSVAAYCLWSPSGQKDVRDFVYRVDSEPFRSLLATADSARTLVGDSVVASMLVGVVSRDANSRYRTGFISDSALSDTYRKILAIVDSSSGLWIDVVLSDMRRIAKDANRPLSLRLLVSNRMN